MDPTGSIPFTAHFLKSVFKSVFSVKEYLKATNIWCEDTYKLTV